MKDELNYFEFIEKYLDGVMSREEKIWFGKELDSNTWLQQQVDLHKRINAAIAETEVLDLEKQLNTIHQALEFDKPAKIHKSKPKIRQALLAGAMVSIIGISSFFVYTNVVRDYSTDELYHKYYSPYQSHVNVRSGNEVIDKELNLAMQKYEQKDYYNALRLFEKILDRDESRIGINLYSGISQMEIEEYHNANKSFQKIIDDNQNLYIDQAEWYLAFCYLMIDNKEKAIQQFQKIAKSQSYFKKEARKILARL